LVTAGRVAFAFYSLIWPHFSTLHSPSRGLSTPRGGSVGLWPQTSHRTFGAGGLRGSPAPWWRRRDGPTARPRGGHHRQVRADRCDGSRSPADIPNSIHIGWSIINLGVGRNARYFYYTPRPFARWSKVSILRRIFFSFGFNQNFHAAKLPSFNLFFVIFINIWVWCHSFFLSCGFARRHKINFTRFSFFVLFVHTS